MPIRSIASIATVLACATAAHAGALTVSIDGVEDRGGTFYISIQSEAEFMKQEGTAGDVISNIEAGTFSKSYDVPAGRYAVSIWHDENGNGVFDTEETGMPLDGWAMSGNALTGPPTFDDVAVSVPAEGNAVRLAMSYHR
ncbi:MAG: DUF2141 domain-containing protein [Pseudomonadota bacterium]